MKKASLFILLMVSVFCVFSSETERTFFNDSLKLTAYKITKDHQAGERPAEVVDIYLFDGSSNQLFIAPVDASLTNTPVATVPISARTTEYSTFSWTMFGNYYKQLDLIFIFYPMVRYTFDEQSGTYTPDYSNCIPYSCSLVHSDVKIGNTSIDVNKEPTTLSPIHEEYTNKYFKYADNISGDIYLGIGQQDPFDVISTNQSGVLKSIAYNLSARTVVQELTISYDGGGNETRTYSDVSYSDTICNYWSRSGYATIKLNLDDNSTIENDKYYAFVKVEISKQ